MRLDGCGSRGRRRAISLSELWASLNNRIFTAPSTPVAHRTLDEATLTIAQSDEALAHIEEVMQKYYTMLAGPALVGLEPAIQFDWEKVFTFPWIEPQPPDDDGE